VLSLCESVRSDEEVWNQIFARAAFVALPPEQTPGALLLIINRNHRQDRQILEGAACKLMSSSGAATTNPLVLVF
jgi:hypothetical protein